MSKTIYGGSSPNDDQQGNQSSAPAGKGTVMISDANASSRISKQNPLIGFLVSFSKGTAGESWELREGNLYILGKAGDADIPLNEKSVSDHHANLQIRRSNDDEKKLMVVVTDTNSTNGTVVNGKDIGINGHISLQHLDKIKIGNYDMVFMMIDREKLQLAPNENFQGLSAQAEQSFDYSQQSLYNKRTQAG
jgi:pSer/pThr/pTyr-binding forkhead associated (FHA) protein